MNKSSDSKKTSAASGKGKRYKHGAIAAATTAVFIAVIILVNVAAEALSEKYPVTVDVTHSSYNSLTEENKKMISKFKDDISVTVLADKNSFLNSDFLKSQYSIYDNSNGEYQRQAIRMLEDYTKYNSHISLRFVDSASPEYAAYQNKYPNEEFNPGYIVVECNGNSRILKTEDILDLDTETQTDGGSYYTISGSKLETSLTSAIVLLQSGRVVTANVITGHGSSASDDLTAMLESNNYKCKTVKELQFEKLDKDCDLLIINTPTTDFTEKEISALDKFLSSDGEYGKMLMYIAANTQPKLPKLEKFLASWGVKPTEGIIYETDATRYYQYNFLTVLDYATDDYSTLKNKDLNCITYANRVFDTSGADKAKDYTLTSLLTAPESAVLCPMDEEKLKNFDLTAAEKGPFTAAVISTKQSEDKKSQSCIFALGTPYFVKEETLSHSSYGNSDFIMQTLNQNLGRDDADVYFNPKAIGTESALIDSKTANIIGVWVFMIAVPVAILAAGIFIWLRRSAK